MLASTATADANAALVAEDPEVRLPAAACERPWFAALADAVRAGILTVPVMTSIRRGIGEPTPGKATFGVDPDTDAITGVKRPGFGGGSDLMEDESHGSTQEVSGGVA
jgi:hypothetical protein